MNSRALITVIALCICCAMFTSAQPLPVLIIYPLECNGLDAQQNLQANAIFEEGLIKSGKYQVINERDFQLLLKAQGTLLSGLFDETKLLTAGRLLPAELLAKGSIESKQSLAFIQLKILDLATGAVLNTETASGISLETELRSAVFRLTGTAAPETAASRYISLTITADCKDATVFIDGKIYGKVPLLIENITAGSYFVEIKKESLYYSEKVIAVQNTTVYGVLKQRFGSLIITTVPDEATVMVGDTNYGKTRFIEQIAAQNQQITLSKPGFFWQGDIPVIADKTVKVAVVLQPTATVRIMVDDTATSQFYGNNRNEEFRGSWEIKDLLPGVYTFTSQRPGYRIHHQTINIGAAEQITLSPEWEWNEATIASMGQLQSEKERIVQTLQESLLPKIYIDNPPPALDMIALKNTCLAFLPGFDLLILTEKPLLPYKQAHSYRIISGLQLGTGLLCQAGLASLLLSDDNTVQLIGTLTALISGCTNVVLGIVSNAAWRRWTHNQKALKNQYDGLKNNLTEIESALADYD